MCYSNTTFVKVKYQGFGKLQDEYAGFKYNIC